MTCAECGRFIDDKIKWKSNKFCSLCEEYIEREKKVMGEFRKKLNEDVDEIIKKELEEK